ncbi:hypothetical protein MLD38_001746 [Melastoma candidum]|uniref:Uncharacterized protein n=1 Tax=Melastoma candidum TaxID=119954 RepID=A0ACB9SEA5_9MYRT|nr:hypothetical protein MLD38_001746 [Melastoma candidum]
MLAWIQLTLAVTIVVVLVIVTAAFVLWPYFCRQRADRADGVGSLQDGIAKLHEARTGLPRQLDLSSRRRPGYSVFGRGASARPLFCWADHPSLITDAVENGWSRFAFMGYKSWPSSRSSLLGACASGDPQGRGVPEPEISWEVSHGSADFMQKIRLNSGLKRVNSSNPLAAACVIKAALPLPGPPLGNLSFPQEAYFEITVLDFGSDHSSRRSGVEGERIKLIRGDPEMKANSESFFHVASARGNNKMEESKLNVKDDGIDEPVLLSIGFTAGGALPLKLPGTYAGSIGFNSTGSIYMDGSKVMFESKKTEWGRTEKVIGCGFDPRQKKVYFTIDSELVEVVHGKAEEYGAPLYPTLAANNDVTVLVNFGQGPFKYSPANTHRTSNPCFIGPLAGSPAMGAAYEDSRELFSMGRIDSGWLHRSVNRGSYPSDQHTTRTIDFDEESEADLFEIFLDSASRSAHAAS